VCGGQIMKNRVAAKKIKEFANNFDFAHCPLPTAYRSLLIVNIDIFGIDDAIIAAASGSRA
jgi:hypothetical protein